MVLTIAVLYHFRSKKTDLNKIETTVHIIQQLPKTPTTNSIHLLSKACYLM